MQLTPSPSAIQSQFPKFPFSNHHSRHPHQLAGSAQQFPPWAPATDGLRNITGVVNGDGTATIYAITSTISGSGDQGADPNKLVLITDKVDATGPTTPGP